MAEEAAQQPEQAEEAKKKSPLMTIIVVAVLMIVEAVGAFAFIKFSGGGASTADAAELEGEELAEAEKTLEIPIWGDKRQTFQNLSSGRAWSWQVAVVLKVKQKNEEYVTEELGRRQAEITEGVALIVRQAAHSHLTEPGLETMHRQLSALIEQVFGEDAEGVSRVERVMVPKLQGVPSE